MAPIWLRGKSILQEGYQGLAGAQFQQGLVGLEGRVGAEGIGRHFHGLLVLGRVGAEGMLHTVAQLDRIWDEAKTKGL